MNSSPEPTHSGELGSYLARLEARLVRIEKHLKLDAMPAEEEPPTIAPVPERSIAERKAEQDAIEFEIGQNWFAKIGIIVLTAGLAFTLTNPFPGIPTWLPSIAGFLVAGGIYLLTHLGQQAFQPILQFFRGAAMVLLFFATLRLSFFGAQTLFAPASIATRTALLLAVGLNLGLAMRWQSIPLFLLALLSGLTAVLAVNEAWFLLLVLAVLAMLVTLVRLRYNWPLVLVIGAPLVFLGYDIWALNNPFITGDLHLVTEPVSAPWFLLGYIVIFAAGCLLRRDRSREDALTGVSSMVICAMGYGAFLFHTLAASETLFVTWHLITAVVLIGLAVAFWMREKSLVSTFVYAMTGYMALSFAIIKAMDMPDVFVWLALESLVVVTTALSFRSRFIIVANFLIFLGIFAGYILLAESESGVSVVFGVVALVTARILNWKRDRLELKTEMMRNAYLVSAFIIFPYSLYFLVPSSFVALAWMGIALGYYLLHFLFKNRKYRWMGHSTLGLTVIYVVVVGIGRQEAMHRNISFLALGILLLIVSFLFTRAQAKKREEKASRAEPEKS